MRKYALFFLLFPFLIFSKAHESFLSQEAIKEYISSSQIEFRRKMEQASYLLEDPETVSDSLETINEAGMFLTSKLALLKNLHVVTNDPRLIREAMHGFWKLFREINPKMWTSSLEKLKTKKLNPNFTPYTRAILGSLLKTIGAKSPYARVLKKTPSFTYKRGKSTPKNKPDEFSILSLNVCFLQDELPLVFGGMLPWKERIDKVVQLIQDSDADIVCLQEVFDPKANKDLYQRLKETFSDFYIFIAPRCFNLSWRSIGFGSGLFVASKYPLKNPNFYPYQKDNPHINRGLFSFQVVSSEKAEANVFVTHLEPFLEGRELRKNEMKQIVNWMKESKEATSIPHILCGDLNLDLRRGEESEKILLEYFLDPVHANVEKITLENCTSTDFTSFHIDPLHFTRHPQILDYVLQFSSKDLDMEGKVIPCFTDDPKTATSDHHAIFVRFSKKRGLNAP